MYTYMYMYIIHVYMCTCMYMYTVYIYPPFRSGAQRHVYKTDILCCCNSLLNIHESF